jgi:hypothetical protein
VGPDGSVAGTDELDVVDEGTGVPVLFSHGRGVQPGATS